MRSLPLLLLLSCGPPAACAEDPSGQPPAPQEYTTDQLAALDAGPRAEAIRKLAEGEPGKLGVYISDLSRRLASGEKLGKEHVDLHKELSEAVARRLAGLDKVKDPGESLKTLQGLEAQLASVADRLKEQGYAPPVIAGPSAEGQVREKLDAAGGQVAGTAKQLVQDAKDGGAPGQVKDLGRPFDNSAERAGQAKSGTVREGVVLGSVKASPGSRELDSLLRDRAAPRAGTTSDLKSAPPPVPEKKERAAAVAALLEKAEKDKELSPDALKGLDAQQLGDLYAALGLKEKQHLTGRWGGPRGPQLRDTVGSPYADVKLQVWRALLALHEDPAQRARLGPAGGWLGLQQINVLMDLRKLGVTHEEMLAYVNTAQEKARASMRARGLEPDKLADGLYRQLELNVSLLRAEQAASKAAPPVKAQAAAFVKEHIKLLDGVLKGGKEELEKLADLRRRIDAYLKSPEVAASGGHAARQVEELRRIVKRIDEIPAFLERYRPPVDYYDKDRTRPQTLDGLGRSIAHRDQIRGGRVYLVDDSAAGLAGVPHQHLVLEIDYTDAEGKKKTVAWPFGYFTSAKATWEEWGNRAASKTIKAELVHWMDPQQTLAAYDSLRDGQSAVNHAFWDGHVVYATLGSGKTVAVGDWGIFSVFPYAGAAVANGISKVSHWSLVADANCRDVRVYMAAKLDGDLKKLRAGRK